MQLGGGRRMPVYIKGQLARVGSPPWTMWGLGLNSDH